MKRTKNKQRMLTAVILTLLLVANRGFAVSYGAAGAGPVDWSLEGTWTPSGGPPGSGDVAYIGSTTPSGSALDATVLVTDTQQVSQIRTGYGASANGTLTIESNVYMTAASQSIGDGGTGVVNVKNGGTLRTTSSSVVGDSVGTGTLNVLGGTLSSVYFHVGLTASANGTVNVESNGSVNAKYRSIGNGGTGVMNIQSGGKSSGTTATIGLAGGTGTLNLLGGSLSTSYLRIGFRASSTGTVNIESNASLTATYPKYIGNGGTGVVNIVSGGTVSLGNTVYLGHYYSSDIGTGTLNLNGNTLQCGNLHVGYYGSSATLNRSDGGLIDVTALYVYNDTFTTASGDAFGTGVFQATDTGVIELGGDVTKTSGNVLARNGGRIDLSGHDLSSGSGYVYIDDNGRIDVGANTLSALELHANDLGAGTHALLDVGGGRVVVNRKLWVKNSRDLYVTQDPGTKTGLELNDDGTADQLSIADGCVLRLDFDGESTAGQIDWLFRWKNPSDGGDRVSDLEALFTAGKIVANLACEVVDGGDGYTYIYAGESGPSVAGTVFTVR